MIIKNIDEITSSLYGIYKEEIKIRAEQTI